MVDLAHHTKRAAPPGKGPVAYHPALISLHWLSAILVVAAIASGKFWLGETPNSAPDKLVPLGTHMALGTAILLLTIARFLVRARTRRPKRLTAGNVLLDRLATATLRGLYIVLVLMAASGLATAVISGLPAIVLTGVPGSLPDISHLTPRLVHEALSYVLIVLVSLHVLGALYHHYVRRDGLMSRMWFGRRSK
jgi:cytochrome b561